MKGRTKRAGREGESSKLSQGEKWRIQTRDLETTEVETGRGER